MKQSLKIFIFDSKFVPTTVEKENESDLCAGTALPMVFRDVRSIYGPGWYGRSRKLWRLLKRSRDKEIL